MFSQLSKRPWLIAVAISLLLLLWLFSGSLFKAQETASADAPAEQKGLTKVEVQWLEASPMQRQHVVQGQIEAWRRVELRSQVSGTVTRLDQDKGNRTVIARFTEEAIIARGSGQGVPARAALRRRCRAGASMGRAGTFTRQATQQRESQPCEQQCYGGPPARLPCSVVSPWPHRPRPTRRIGGTADGTSTIAGGRRRIATIRPRCATTGRAPTTRHRRCTMPRRRRCTWRRACPSGSAFPCANCRRDS